MVVKAFFSDNEDFKLKEFEKTIASLCDDDSTVNGSLLSSPRLGDPKSTTTTDSSVFDRLKTIFRGTSCIMNDKNNGIVDNSVLANTDVNGKGILDPFTAGLYSASTSFADLKCYSSDSLFKMDSLAEALSATCEAKDEKVHSIPETPLTQLVSVNNGDATTTATMDVTPIGADLSATDFAERAEALLERFLIGDFTIKDELFSLFSNEFVHPDDDPFSSVISSLLKFCLLKGHIYWSAKLVQIAWEKDFKISVDDLAQVLLSLITSDATELARNLLGMTLLRGYEDEFYTLFIRGLHEIIKRENISIACNFFKVVEDSKGRLDLTLSKILLTLFIELGFTRSDKSPTTANTLYTERTDTTGLSIPPAGLLNRTGGLSDASSTITDHGTSLSTTPSSLFGLNTSIESRLPTVSLSSALGGSLGSSLGSTLTNSLALGTTFPSSSALYTPTSTTSPFLSLPSIDAVWVAEKVKSLSCFCRLQPRVHFYVCFILASSLESHLSMLELLQSDRQISQFLEFICVEFSSSYANVVSRLLELKCLTGFLFIDSLHIAARLSETSCLITKLCMIALQKLESIVPLEFRSSGFGGYEFLTCTGVNRFVHSLGDKITCISGICKSLSIHDKELYTPFIELCLIVDDISAVECIMRHLCEYYGYVDEAICEKILLTLALKGNFICISKLLKGNQPHESCEIFLLAGSYGNEGAVTDFTGRGSRSNFSTERKDRLERNGGYATIEGLSALNTNRLHTSPYSSTSFISSTSQPIAEGPPPLHLLSSSSSYHASPSHHPSMPLQPATTLHIHSLPTRTPSAEYNAYEKVCEYIVRVCIATLNFTSALQFTKPLLRANRQSAAVSALIQQVSVKLESRSKLEAFLSFCEKISILVDENAFSAILDCCLKLKNSKRLLRLINKFRTWGLQPQVQTYGVIVKSLSCCGMIDECKQLWDEYTNERGLEPNEVMYGCMFDAFVSNNRVDDAMKLFYEMKSKGRVKPNTIMYTTLIKGFGQNRQLDKALKIFNMMCSENVAANTVTYNSIIDACARVGDMNGAASLLEDMLNNNIEPDLITFSTIIKGYCVQSNMDKSFQLLSIMYERGIMPDVILYNSLLEGCVKSGLLWLCEKLWEQMQQYGIPPSNFTLTILIKMYGRNGQLDKVFDLADRLPKEYGFTINTHVYTCLMSACITNGKYTVILDIYKCMKNAGVRADAKTFETLIQGASKGGLYAEAAEIISDVYSLSNTSGEANIPNINTKIIERLFSKVYSSVSDHGILSIYNSLARRLELFGIKLNKFNEKPMDFKHK